jgi:hypothetical protein
VRVLRARRGEVERSSAFGVARQLLAEPVAAIDPERRERVLSVAAELAVEVVDLRARPAGRAVGSQEVLDARLYCLYWLCVGLAELRPLFDPGAGDRLHRALRLTGGAHPSPAHASAERGDDGRREPGCDREHGDGRARSVDADHEAGEGTPDENARPLTQPVTAFAAVRSEVPETISGSSAEWARRIGSRHLRRRSLRDERSARLLLAASHGPTGEHERNDCAANQERRGNQRKHRNNTGQRQVAVLATSPGCAQSWRRLLSR